MSERTEIWIMRGLIALLILSLLAVIVGIIGQIVTTGTVRTW